MTNNCNWYEELLHTVNAADNTKTLDMCIRLAAFQLGFEYCALEMVLPLPLSRPKQLVLSNYSEHWLQRYAEKEYAKIDPTVLLGRHSIQPIVWEPSHFADVPYFRDEAHTFGLRYSCTQSCQDASGAASLFTLSRSAQAISEQELAENALRIRGVALAVHNTFIQIALTEEAKQFDTSLTTREIEVLRWSADGKSANEIASILELSKNTVDFHIKNAIIKMKTNNKTAAVVKAMSFGFLRD